MRVVTYNDQGIIMQDTGMPDIAAKTIYSKPEFIAKIPKNKIREIQAAAATNDDINVWIFNLPLMDVIDLNDLPIWFIEGLNAMATIGIFTQANVDNFLEM